MMTPIRQKRILVWVLKTFGSSAAHRHERAARLVEEAVEAAQAVGLPRDTVQKIAWCVYSRPPGDINQELAGVALTLDAFAEVFGIDVQRAALTELERVEAIDPDLFRAKLEEKRKNGISFI